MPHSSCMWTQILSDLGTVFQGCTISSGQAERSKAPPEVKLQGLLPGFWLQKRVLLQRSKKWVVRKPLPLQRTLSWSNPPGLLCTPKGQQQRALLEKLGMVGTFTQISHFFKCSLPCCGFSCCGDWFVFNELMLLVEIFLRWVTHVSFGKIHMEILPSRSAPD